MKKDTMLGGRNSTKRSLVSCWILFSSWAVCTLAIVEGFAQQSTVATATNKRILIRHKQTLSSATSNLLCNERNERNHFSLSKIRGGQQAESSSGDVKTPEQQQVTVTSEESTTTKEAKFSITSIPAMSTLAATLTSIGKWYAQSLDKRPILTKSVTACGIFAISDYLAQRLEKSSSSSSSDSKEHKLNWTRLLSGAAVGLLYFGPAAHYWYEMIFQLLPGTTLVSTLQKAVMGQLLFGPSFTCIFFAVSLLQAGSFSLSNWTSKIRQDLPGAWLAGAGFWPLVDLVSYSIIPKNYIPLFVNLCSLVWTIYLSLVANRGASKTN